MAELTVANLFDTAYDKAAAGIKTRGFASADPWSKLVLDLRKLLGTADFDEVGAPALAALRKAAAKAVTKTSGEGAFLLKGAVVASPATDEAIARCAALKFLRHTYFLSRRGSHKMWIVSLPKSYSRWPEAQLKANLTSLDAQLGDVDEQFDKAAQLHISTATQTGLKWVLKTTIALDDVSTKSKTMVLLKKWFADEDTTETQLTTFAATLKAELKKIAGKLSDGSVIVTDFVPIRHSTDPGDIGFRGSNAFVWADTRQVIYIEPAFFTNSASNVFQKDSRHWARIVVHEMTHRIAKTLDKRYGWAGVKPAKATFPHADAIVNADSWALFVADAAGAMSSGDLARALK